MDLCWQSNISAFNRLSLFGIAFLPWNEYFLISWLQSLSAVILESKKIKPITVSIFAPSICHEVMGPDIIIFVSWMLSCKPGFSLSFHLPMVKNLPAMQETWVWSLGWENLLEKGTATISVFWPGEFHGLYSPLGHKESDTTELLSLSGLGVLCSSKYKCFLLCLAWFPQFLLHKPLPS